MPSRRNMLQWGLALGASSAASACARPPVQGATVRSVARRDETILRLGGVGDGYHMTWRADDSQLLVVNDGPGWAENPTAFYNSRLWTVSGPPQGAVFREAAGYPELSSATLPEGAPQYHGSGLLAVRGRVFQFLSTLDRATERPRHWTGAKLIYSDDGGRTWRNQDGSSPVVWEDWKAQSRERFAFFQEPDGCFSLLSILQMGRDYGANRDGYVYVYGVNGNVDGRMNELVMFRVRIEDILERDAFEYFGGMSGTGQARWVRDIQARGVVHRFPRGWVNRTNLFPGDLVVESWLPSVVYNEPLGLYLMASAGVGCAPDGTEFGKPSYLGFWVSSTPWGPWRQIHEDTAWTPEGDLAARAYAPRISPRWIAADGRSFWIAWGDLQGMLSFARDEPKLSAELEKIESPEERSATEIGFLKRYMPRYALNAQRVDLVLG